MLQIEDYSEQIIKLHSEGLTGREIQRKLNFKNHQPIYNFLTKRNLVYNPRTYPRKYTLNENYFKVINSEDKAYILGFICADGHIENNRICITLSIKDVEILEKIKFYMGSTQELRYYEATNPYLKSNNKILKMVDLSINSVTIVKPLIKMGLLGNKTLSLDNLIINYIPSYLKVHFLRGYFDGDGNISFGKKYSSGSKYNINICGNKSFLLSTYQKEFPSNCSLYKDKYSKQCYIWKLSSKQKVKEFLNYLYYNSSIFLRRKYIIYLKSKHVDM